MTIDEAIKHARDKAKEQRKDYDTCVVKEGYGCKDCAYYYSKPCIKCAEEHEQLADWLEELKEYKKLNIIHCKDCKYWVTGVIGETENIKYCEYGGYMVGANGYCVYAEKESAE